MDKILALLHQEVKPALGCTEPIAVALAVARSCEEVGSCPEKIDVEVSSNILKNGMGVGIPGTDMVGLHIATALAAFCGKSEYKLEVLKDLKKEDIAKAKKMIDEKRVSISIAKNNIKLYVKATAYGNSHKACTILQDSHDGIVEVTKDDVVVFKKGSYLDKSTINKDDTNLDLTEYAKKLTIKEIYEFATTAPFEKIEFILDSATLNRALAEEGLKKKYGLQVGQRIVASSNKPVFGDSLMSYAMAMTAAASDARMAGSTLPAMSNSGSGNQGITVTVPVIAIADKTGVKSEELARALIISHLVAIHIKGYLGKLSALCGCVIASTGSSCGIVYLRGGGYKEICAAIKNMTGNITGMVCDGAKVGCALKVASGVACSLQSAILALDDICISSNDGIIDNDVEKTIANLGQIGSVGMQSTDEMILNIMVCK